ncbi:50S ribosomal protein L11 methyltransferase [Bradyrhizobium sp. Pa8]|uniref:50S ribosomal protein L11 methyltransferase n=1 Tax=Bradyrhizobium sp. Pa8 TaxID=3386552 RepID=UPI00403FB900
MDFASSSTAGMLFYASRAAFILSRFAFLLVGRRRHTRLYEGHYCGMIYHGRKGDLHIADVVRIKAGWNKISAEPLWKHDRQNDYSMYITIHDSLPDFIYGYWQHNRVMQRFGAFVFRRHNDRGRTRFLGTYIGVSSQRTIQNSTWILDRVDDSKPFTYFDARNLLKRRRALLKNKDLLKSIIEKHRGYFADSKREPFEYRGKSKRLSFIIPSNGFNPDFGKISIPLLQRTIEDVPSLESMSVLDVGCGSGFYAIALAERGAKKCVGLDIEQSTINVARDNARRNGVQALCDFRQSYRNNIFSQLPIKEKYDLIIANLPFTNHWIGKRYKKEALAVNFVSSDKMLFDFFMGVRMHLAKNGKLYMSYGDSGYPNALVEFCELCGLDAEQIDSKKERDETFYIYKISHETSKFIPLRHEDLSIAPAFARTIEGVG